MSYQPAITIPPHDRYRCLQPTPIPSYLLAIAAGNLQYQPFQVPDGKQWKSGVWSEPELMDSSFWEFSRDTTR
jgi:leukotriene-A4 hydrolase